MAPGTSRKQRRREQRDLRSILKEISAMLPIKGKTLTKVLKETLAHVLCYLDFLWNHIQDLQSRLPPDYVSEICDRAGCASYHVDENPFLGTNPEPCTPPNFCKAKSMCVRPYKRPPLSREYLADVQHKRRRLYRVGHCDNVRETEVATHTLPVWIKQRDWTEPVQDNDMPMISIDSEFGVSHLVAEIMPHRENCATVDSDHCPACDDQTGSEMDSPGSGVLDSPASGTQPLLFKDPMLTSPPLSDEDYPFTQGSPLRCVSPLSVIPVCGVQDSLNLSPSLLTSPTCSLTYSLLSEGQTELQALFEDVWVHPIDSSVKAPPVTTFSHSSVEKVQILRERTELSSQSEDEDSAWTPSQEITERKGKNPYKKRSTPNRRPLSRSSLKKKCINGFIMFCQINRKVYLRSHPGTPSTVVTKELANLWHVMPKQERRVYCAKARHFSCQQNRNVKMEGKMEVEAEEGVPSPLHMLLAQRDLYTAA